MIGDMLTPEMCYAFHQDMYFTQSPEGVAHTMVNQLLTDTRYVSESRGCRIHNGYILQVVENHWKSYIYAF